MASIAIEYDISKEEYIALKRKAYAYYKEYNLLDRISRTRYLKEIPECDTSLKTMIIKNTLLFPDTKELVMASKGSLQRILREIAKTEDNITNENIMSKCFEYSIFNINQLIANGDLWVMDPIKYPDDSIPEKKYLSIKSYSVECNQKFLDLVLSKKVAFIEKCSSETDYEAKIQLSTLLLPNDEEIMNQLKHNSIDDMATYYQVPKSIIEFKQEEYNKQGTKKLIEEKKIPRPSISRHWYQNGLENPLIGKLWDQSFYQEIETKYISDANTILDNVFINTEKKREKV